MWVAVRVLEDSVLAVVGAMVITLSEKVLTVVVVVVMTAAGVVVSDTAGGTETVVLVGGGRGDGTTGAADGVLDG